MWCDVINFFIRKTGKKWTLLPTARDLVQLTSNNSTLARRFGQ